MTKKTYNGWNTYATWRVKLELFDDFDPYFNFSDNQATMKDHLAEYLKDYAEEMIFGGIHYSENRFPKLMEGYARAFLDDVDWQEIAHAMILDYPDEVQA